MINGYVNLPNSVKNIIENYYENGTNKGKITGIYNELVSLPDKPTVIKIHINEFFGLSFNADFVTQPVMVKQHNGIDIQSFLFITTPLSTERFIMAIAVTVKETDDFEVTAGLFKQFSLDG